MAKNLFDILLPKCDELIVAEDGGMFHIEFDTHSKYVYTKQNVGSMKNINKGLRLFTGDFIAVINSDVKNIAGDIRSLCDENYVTSPKVNEYPEFHNFNSAFFVIPRTLLFSHSLFLWEYSEGSDGDYARMLNDKKLFKSMDTVTFSHPGGLGKSYTARKKILGR